MEEEEYLELQNLLLKQRVLALKELSNSNLRDKDRDNCMKTIRKIDWLRNNIKLNLGEKK